MQIDEIRKRYMMDRMVTMSMYEYLKAEGMSDAEIRETWKKTTYERIPYDVWAKKVGRYPEPKKPKSGNIYDPANRKKLEKWKQRQAVEKAHQEYLKMTPEQKRRRELEIQNKNDSRRANVMRLFAKTH